MVETSDEWIVTRTGIRERRIAAKDEFTSDMGVEAALRALQAAGRTAQEIDLILVATLTPDYIFPSTAALIQHRLGATQAAAFDFQAACTGFLYGLSLAKAYILSGMYKNILLISSEKLSSIVNYQDRNTCVLFGDGASAAVISSDGEGFALEEICLGAEGEHSEMIILPAGGCRAPASPETIQDCKHFISMDGKAVFKHAVRTMENAAKLCLERSGLSESAVEWLIPHQANERIIDAIAKRFSIEPSRVYKTVHKYGNTSASAISIALDELIQEQVVKPQEVILLVAFGAGFTWGAAILRKL